MRARMGAYALHSKHDSRETTKAGREAFLARFEREVDPDGRLPERERKRRAQAAMRAYMSGLAFKRSRSRSRRDQQPEPA